MGHIARQSSLASCARSSFNQMDLPSHLSRHLSLTQFHLRLLHWQQLLCVDFFAASSLPLILSHRYNVRSTTGLTVFLPLRPPSSPPISGLQFTSATFAPSDDSRPQSHCRLTRGFAACGPIAGRSHQSSTSYCTDTIPQGMYSAGTRARARGEQGNPSHRGRNE